MADLCLIHPRLNPYYRDARIRRCLLNAGLINRYGDIVRGTPITTTATKAADAEEATARLPRRRRKPRENSEQQAKIRDILNRPLPDETTRPKSAHPSTGNLRAKSAHRPTTSKRRSPPPPTKENCRLTLRYLKTPSKIDHEINSARKKGDEIIVMQQHCGGENLTVYKDFVEPGGSFSFDSLRHPEFPFALAFYINGLIDSRVSTCCEYRHRKNTPLGGPSGSFAITKIAKGQPCSSCQIRFEKKRNKFPPTAEHVLIGSRRLVLTKPEHHGRSPSLPRPQSPTPPLDENKRSKKRRSLKKKVTTQESSSTPIESPLLPPKANEIRANTPKSDKSQASTAVLLRTVPLISNFVETSDDPKLKPKVEQKLDRTLSNDDDDDSEDQNETPISPKIPSSDLYEKKPITETPDDNNYVPDFDEASDDDVKPKSNSQLARAYSSDNREDSDDYPSKSTQKKTISTDSTDNLYDQDSSDLFTAKKSQRTSNTIEDNDESMKHVRQDSTDSFEKLFTHKRSSPTRNQEDDFFQLDEPSSQRNAPSWRDDAAFFDRK